MDQKLYERWRNLFLSRNNGGPLNAAQEKLSRIKAEQGEEPPVDRKPGEIASASMAATMQRMGSVMATNQARAAARPVPGDEDRAFDARMEESARKYARPLGRW